jgi:hypothetical protein
MNRRRTLCAATPSIYVMAVAVVMSLTSSRDVLSQVHSKPVTDSTVLYELEGYTVLPPPGKNWFEMRRDRRQALFGKKIESPTHSFAAAAVSATLGQKFENRTEFEAYVRNLKAQDVDSARYRLVEYVAEPEMPYAAWCVRYRTTAQDRQAPYAQGTVLLLEHAGIACVHPDKTDLIVDVGFSERGRPAEFSSELRSEGESFMRSLKFLPQ